MNKPETPNISATTPPPRPVEQSAADLARKRKTHRKKRRGTSSLRIDPAISTGSGGGTGMSIPNG